MGYGPVPSLASFEVELNPPHGKFCCLVAPSASWRVQSHQKVGPHAWPRGQCIAGAGGVHQCAPAVGAEPAALGVEPWAPRLAPQGGAACPDSIWSVSTMRPWFQLPFLITYLS